MFNSIIFEYSAWFILLCITIAFGYAFFLYFKNKKLKELSAKKVWTMAVLRFFSSLIISLLLLAPLLKSTTTTVEKPIIIFANDNTESLPLSCQSEKNKFISMKNTLSKIVTSVSKNFEVQTFSFGDKFEEGFSFDYTGKQTNIEDVFDQINDKFYNKNIGAVVLISDGIYNAGINPIYKAKNLSYPVYTIGVGDTSIYKDLSISRIQHNEIAFLKNKFPLEISIIGKKLKVRCYNRN